MKLLVVRNLNLKLIEFATSQIETAVGLVKREAPEAIMVAGNISKHDKRSLLLAEELVAATGLPVLYNLGILEYASIANWDYLKTAVLLRLRVNAKKTNVHWVEDWEHPEVQFRHVMNWPLITASQDEYYLTHPGRFLIKERKPLYLEDVLADPNFPRPFKVEDINALHGTERVEWAEGKKRVLLTAIDYEQDAQITVPFENRVFYGQDATISASGPSFEIRVI